MMDSANPDLSFFYLLRDEFPPFRPDVDTLFFEEVASRGFSVTFALQSGKPQPAPTQEIWRGSTVFVSPNRTGFSPLARVTRQWRRLRHDLHLLGKAAQGPYDFIQIKDLLLTAALGSSKARRHRKPFVYWLSFPYPEADQYNASLPGSSHALVKRLRSRINSHLLYNVILPNSHHAFVQSAQMKRDIMARGIPADKLTPVPMGLRDADIPSVSTIRARATRPGLIAYLGTLSRARRLDFLLRSFARVVAANPDAHLLMVGSSSNPADEQELLETATELGISDKVTFTGFLSRNEAWNRILEAQVCVSPFFPTPILQSTSPTKLIEYFALGKPVVANDHPEQREVITASRGGLSVPYDEDSFAAALMHLLQNRELCQEMGLNGRTYALEHRTYQRIADIVCDTYRRLFL